MFTSILNPVLALIIWSLLIWGLMYSRRLPAMRKAGILPQNAAHPGALSSLPSTTRAAADNYNHLHEQPTIFYALCFFHHLAVSPTGQVPSMVIGLGWSYVLLRVIHSLIQVSVNFVPLRFIVFVLSTITLILMALLALF